MGNYHLIPTITFISYSIASYSIALSRALWRQTLDEYSTINAINIFAYYRWIGPEVVLDEIILRLSLSPLQETGNHQHPLP